MSAELEGGNAAVIGALLAELDALGVREYCVCAGARNAPLLEVLTRRTAGKVIHSFYEERSAAFFALGRVMATRVPVAVVTTSGTAVAELFPAVMEAHYQALPLVVVTADRPSRYRGSGAPQAVEQQRIFGQYVAREVEIEAGTLIEDVGVGLCGTGPVHFNVCLEEGLSPDELAGASHEVPPPKGSPVTEAHLHEWQKFWKADGGLVVVVSGIHPGDVPQVRDFLVKLGAPVVAEATSNLAGEEPLRPLLVRGGEQALKQMCVSRALRLGAVPSWRWWRDLDGRDDMRVLNVTRAPFRGMARTREVAVVPWEMLSIPGPESATASNAAVTGYPSEKLEGLLKQFPHSELAWMRQLSRVVGADSMVFLGNSLPIREWNLAADIPKRGTRFFANRGANGIDGLISTWLGVGAEERESWLIVGDLSALYDLGAPWILRHLRGAKRRLVVINNGGGKIFSRVSWLKDAGAETKALMENPHEIGFEPWARMWGMDYRLLTEAQHLQAAKEDDDDAACAVWEVRPDAGDTEAFWAEWGR